MSRKQLTVLVVGPVLPPLAGGIASFIQSVYSCAAFDGMNIRFLDTAHETGNNSMVRRILLSIRYICSLVLQLLLSRPDAVHLHSSAFLSFYEKGLMMALCRVRGCRTLLHIHSGFFGPFYENSILKPLIRFILRRPDTLAAVSDFWKKYLEAVSGRTAVCIPNCAGKNYFEQPAAGREGNDILFAGKLCAEKGVPVLLEAFFALREQGRDCRLVLAAIQDTGGEAERIGRMCDILPESSVSVITGSGKDEIRKLMDNAAVFALPSMIEGMPIALLEAMARGLPVVASRTGGIPEAVREGENGFLVEPGDSAAMAGRLAELLDNADLRDNMGRRNIREARERFHPDLTAERLASLYRALAARSAVKAESQPD